MLVESIAHLGHMVPHIFDLGEREFPPDLDNDVFDAVSHLVEAVDDPSFARTLADADLSSLDFALEILRSSVDEGGLSKLADVPVPISVDAEPPLPEVPVASTSSTVQALEVPPAPPVSNVPRPSSIVTAGQDDPPYVYDGPRLPSPRNVIWPPIAPSPQPGSSSKSKKSKKSSSHAPEDGVKKKRSLLFQKMTKSRKG
jgi:hypothetical protein